LPTDSWKKVAANKAKVITSRSSARKRQTFVLMEQMTKTNVRTERVA
jgi:hypothetical protein